MAVTTHPVGSEQTWPRRSTVGFIVRSLRPEQWTKNLVLFAALIVGGRLLDPESVLRAGAAFAIFCVLSGAVYLFNDLVDGAADEQHPLKRHRPIASGQLAPSTAALAAATLAPAGILAALWLHRTLGLVAAGYLILMLAYSVAFKHAVIIDALTIAAGFVLRAVAGAFAIGVPISQWLLVCTTLLALFLVLSKRRHELTLLSSGGTIHRRILLEYSPFLLDQMIAVVTASTLIAYVVYATSAETAARLGTPRLGLTIPFVLYGIFRCLYIVHQKRGGDSPAAMLLSDRPLLACVAVWTFSVILLLYSPVGHAYHD